ncbi:MAG TPA: DinB family protein [Trebonia sp.]|jgi:hypothetical protein|nr:DinB family protein [Trebonia sp.]
MKIVPDTKDWTWVLERPCPECGFNTNSFDVADLPAMIRAIAAAWLDALLMGGIGGNLFSRPAPDKWSPLEYTCHVRDVFKLYDYRLALMLSEDNPLFPNWDQDETALAERYGEQDPNVVKQEFRDAAAAVASRFAGVQAGQWQRLGRRGDGAHFTIDTFGRYFIHDPIHHLYDVTGDRYGDVIVNWPA